MFFHQIVLADERGWSLALLASAFSLYAGMKIAASLVSGIVVDRITALRALPFSAIPLILAFASLLLPPDAFGIYAPFVYLGLCGLNLGMIGPVSGGLWPEPVRASGCHSVADITHRHICHGRRAGFIRCGY